MFKESFKYYKSKSQTPSHENVIDFDKINENTVIVRPIDSSKFQNNDGFRMRGLLPPEQWKIFEIKDRPGLILIRNPFTIRGQRYWIAKCLQDYPKAPHAVNLDRKHFGDNIINDWWKCLQDSYETGNITEQARLKNGLRWTTLGYHHDWDTKVYAEKKRHKFPNDLAKLNEYFAVVLGFGKYSAEAAIVNFYPLGTTLAGHTDHSEKNLNAPLFSISFGATAIFLLGGKTKDEKPTAMFLKSGDVVCMSRESRLCYHAVPKIMKTDVNWINASLDENPENIIKAHDHNDCDDRKNTINKKRRLNHLNDEQRSYDDAFSENVWNLVIQKDQWKPFGDYIFHCRINMNVRQVLDHGKQTLDSE